MRFFFILSPFPSLSLSVCVWFCCILLWKQNVHFSPQTWFAIKFVLFLFFFLSIPLPLFLCHILWLRCEYYFHNDNGLIAFYETSQCSIYCRYLLFLRCVYLISPLSPWRCYFFCFFFFYVSHQMEREF